MKDSPESRKAEALPHAKLRKTRWNFSFIWLVPMAAAAVAGYLIYQRATEFGPEVVIRFHDATGIKAGQTQVEYRGVALGEVIAVSLSKDHQQVEVKIHFKHSVADIARQNSVFWIVRPEVGIASITGLGTIIAGPHIEVLPGSGPPQTKFIGLENSPAGLESDGLKITLLSSRLTASKSGSPVYYRGVEVGAVNDCQLSTNALTVETHVILKHRYANLVRSGTKFWNVSGLDASFGLFRGLNLNVESVKSLVVGGIAFATPEETKGSEPAKDGAVFELHDEAKKEWLEWSPQISIPPAN